MSKRDSASAYHQASAVGASSVGQVVAVYDIILRDFHRAIAAIDAGDVEKRINAANHALTAIGELQGVLDFERGAEAARNLKSFYSVTRAMVNQASITSSREKFQELISMFARLRSAWSHVEHTVAPSEPNERLRISSERQPPPPQSAPVPSESSDGTKSGRWEA
jgi:flagellar secretion chaperone FliS